MINKIVIIANVLLVGFYAWHLFALHERFSPRQVRTADSLSAQPLALKARDLRGDAPFRNIFDTKPLPPKPAATKKPSSKKTAKPVVKPVEKSIDAMTIDDLTIRVEGIFTSPDMRYAILSVGKRASNPKKKSPRKIVKAQVGEIVHGVEIGSIEADAVGFLHPASQVTYLRIFKDDRL